MSVRIKICGITTPDDAVLAAKLGADAIGLNFYTGSPRYISTSRAAEIVAALPPFVEPVALFVNESAENIQQTALELGIRTVQVHGLPVALDERLRWIPAYAVRDSQSLDAIANDVATRRPAAVLVDAHVPGMHGGTGRTAPWQLLAGWNPGVPLILAGGLTPENVAEAIRIVRPYAVDVASGVESAPGRKDADKLRRFIENARSGASVEA